VIGWLSFPLLVINWQTTVIVIQYQNGTLYVFVSIVFKLFYDYSSNEDTFDNPNLTSTLIAKMQSSSKTPSNIDYSIFVDQGIIDSSNDRRKEVSTEDLLKHPHNCIGLLEMIDQSGEQSIFGTAFLISSNILITSANLFYINNCGKM
jgi:V8-like Glu-specific endopeptidase